MNIHQKANRIIAALLCLVMMGGFFTMAPLAISASAAGGSMAVNGEWTSSDIAANNASLIALDRVYGGSGNPEEDTVTIELDLVRSSNTDNSWIVFDKIGPSSTNTARAVWFGVRGSTDQQNFVIFDGNTQRNLKAAGLFPQEDNPDPIPTTGHTYHVEIVVDLKLSTYSAYVTDITPGSLSERTPVYVNAGYRSSTGVGTSGIGVMWFYTVNTGTTADYIKNLIINGEPQGKLLDANPISDLYQTVTVSGDNMTFYKDTEITSSPTVTATVRGLEFIETPDKSRFSFSNLPDGITIESVTGTSNKSEVDIVLGGTPTEDWTASIGALTIESSQFDIPEYDNPGPAAAITSASSAVTITVLDGTPPSVPTTGISLDETSISLFAGGSEKLTATLTPSDSTDGITWSTSDSSVAAVNQAGLVTAVGIGSATITAASGSYSAVCSVTVNEIPGTDPNNMILAGSEFEARDVMSDEERAAAATSVWPTAVWTQKPLKNYVWAEKPHTSYFEEWRATTLSGYGTLTYDASTKAAGEQSLLMTVTAQRTTSTAGSGTFLAKMSDKSIVARRGYVFSFWMKNELPVRAYLYETTAANANVSNVYIDIAAGGDAAKAVEAGTDGWYRYEVNLTASTTGNFLKINVGPIDSTGTGKIWCDDYRLLELPSDVTGMGISAEYTTLAVGKTISLTAVAAPSSAVYDELVWSSLNESVATVDQNGAVTAHAIGTAVIEVYAVGYESIKGTVTITVADDLPATGITVTAPYGVSLKAGSYLPLKKELTPGNSNSAVIWSSDNETVATVSGGLVYGVSPGTAVITASANGHTDTIAVTVSEAAQRDEFDELRERWRDYLLPSGYGAEDPEITAIAQGYAEKAQIYWENMNMDAKGDGSSVSNQIWNGKGGLGGLSGTAAGFEVYYDYLYAMALAFAAEGSVYYHDVQLLEDIIFGMEFMDSYLFTASPKWSITNWWERTIGMPKAVNDIVTVLWDYLPEVNRDKYIAKVKSYVYTGDSSGAQYIAANRVDECKIAIVNGILGKNGAQITAAVNNIMTSNSKVLESVTSLNGIYYDGSYVEHSYVAYTSSYGLVLVEGIAQIVYLLGNAETADYRPPSALLTRLDEAMDTTFLPHVFRGNRMASSTGRAISRQDQNVDGAVASRYAALLLMMAEGYDADRAAHYKGLAKTYLQENSSIFIGNTNIGNHLKFKELLADSSVKAVPETTGVFTFNRMARTTVKRSDYLLDFAMHNSRIADYEAGNRENYKGFHTGDGVMYLYNSDYSHYQGNYWATVDYKRLPGTTVDTHAIKNISTSAAYSSGTGAYTNGQITWAGASKLDDYAAVGFLLNKSNITASASASRGFGDSTTVMNLKAAKSWFVFDDEIVALGSGITSGTGRTVETTMENRKITGHTPAFIVDGEEKISSIGDRETVTGAAWAYLEGNVAGADIGYYFPEGADISILRETRTESWAGVNGNKFTYDASPVSDDYVTMYIDHGKDPSGETYEYAVLPGYSAEQVAAYAENPRFEVLNNDADFHAVYHKALGVTAMNNYASSARMSNGIAVDKEASVMVRTYPADYSDPALAGKIKVTVNRILTSGSVTVTLDKGMYGTLAVDSKDSNVTLGTDADGNATITVAYVSSMPQNTWEAVLTSDVEEAPEFDSAVNEAGFEGGTTKVTVGDTLTGSLKYKVSDSVITAPNVGSPAYGLSDYASGEDIFGADAGTNKYLAIYEVDELDRVIKFRLFTITSDKICVYTYTLSVEAGTGGSADSGVNGIYAEGDLITITATADSGYRFSGWVSDNGGEFADVSGASTTFTMPAGDVALTASFTRTGAIATYTVTFNTQGGSSINKITNVAYGSTIARPADPTREGYTFTGWYKEAECKNKWSFNADKVISNITLYAGWSAETKDPDTPLGDKPATSKDYISGYGDGTFRPDSSMTRAEAATISYRLLDDTDIKGSAYSDVSAGDWYYEAVTALSGLGIIKGYEDGSFGPDKTITRAEFAAIAIRFAGLTASDGKSGFDDVPDTHWAAGYIAAAAEAGYISGYPDGTFRPEKNITRAEAVTIINRIIERELGENKENTFTDVPKSHWAYDDIVAAANDQ